MRRTFGVIAALVALVAVAATVVVWQRPDQRLRVTAAVVALEALDVVRLPSSSGAPVESTVIGTVPVDRHGSDVSAPVVVLVPGAAPLGRADPRTVDLAQALARRGRTVVIPELEVYGERLVREDVERLVALVHDLADDGSSVTLVGISFGGSLALLAASDIEVAAQARGTTSPVSLVATFGAHADLLEVATAAIVGESRVGAETFVWEPDPRARDVVRDQVLGLLDPTARGLVQDVVTGDLDPRLLPDHLRAVVDLLEASTWQEATDASRRLPPPVIAHLHDVSPVRIGPGLQVPVVAMHARNDPVIPFAELLRLGQQLPDARLLALEGFGHVDPDGPGGWRSTMADAATVWRFAHAVLDAGT